MITTGDIDIDVVDRNAALVGVQHVSASMIRDQKLVKHNTGVYFHAVPIDPITDLCSLTYENAALRGCFKLDILNVGVYSGVRDEQHLIDLMNRDFDWHLLEEPEFTSQLVHLNGHTDLVRRLKPRSIRDIAFTLALIRPGKKHLIPKCETQGFDSIKDQIWVKPTDDSYWYKPSHAISYAYLVKIDANLLIEKLNFSE